MRIAHTRLYCLMMLIPALVITACTTQQSPAVTAPPVNTPAPTNTPEPSPTPIPAYVADWQGDWFVWVEGDIHRIPAVFTFDGSQLVGTIDREGDKRTFTVGFYPDGISADGTWESANGRHGPLNLLISEDRQTFNGNMGREMPFCGSRSGLKKPNHCWGMIGPDWNGEWIAWLGPDQFEAVLMFKVIGNEAEVMLYDVEGTISQDERTFTGLINDFGIQDAQVEARILDNMAQFTGNIMGAFPFCGVRRGGPKPEVCLGP